jgi:DNA-directed RNA polymerase specialized sigma24 family protein
MISDGIENCLTYVANFDPEKSSNPFAYFTQIIYYAFIRRIQKEKKQTIIKQKLILKSGLDEIVRQEGDNEEYQNSYADFLRKNMIIEEEPVKKEKPKLKKKKIAKLEFFM